MGPWRTIFSRLFEAPLWVLWRTLQGNGSLENPGWFQLCLLYSLWLHHDSEPDSYLCHWSLRRTDEALLLLLLLLLLTWKDTQSQCRCWGCCWPSPCSPRWSPAAPSSRRRSRRQRWKRAERRKKKTKIGFKTENGRRWRQGNGFSVLAVTLRSELRSEPVCCHNIDHCRSVSPLYSVNSGTEVIDTSLHLVGLEQRSPTSLFLNAPSHGPLNSLISRPQSWRGNEHLLESAAKDVDIYITFIYLYFFRKQQFLLVW